MKRILFPFFLALSFSLAGTAQIRDTIKFLYQPFTGDSALLEIEPGKYIVVYNDTEVVYDGDDDNGFELTGIQCPTVNDALKCASNIFQGCIRGNVKTTMLSKSATHFKTVKELQAVLPNKASMKSKGISSLETGGRDVEENRNVLVETAYLFAIYKEDDNDYHMIVGSTPNLKTAVLMNIEISGLPRSANAAIKAKFKIPRSRIETVSYFKDIPCKPSPIKLLKTPIVLKNIKGSLFWDSQHSGGGVGPKAARPKSAWEIHPVIDLTVQGPVGM
jgi:hypothetical protein